MPDIAAPPAPPPKRRGNLFTPANARAMVARSNAIQIRRRAFLKATAKAKSLPPIPNPDFTAKRLSRLRAQLDLVDGAIEREAIKHSPDGQKLDRLASAQARLSAEERKLAGRPEPGKEGKRGARRDRPAGESMLDLGHVSPPASEVSPAPLALPAPSSPSSTVCSTCPPSTPFRLPGDVTP